MSDTHSRRTVLTALAAATTASVPALAVAGSIASHPDAELLRLGAEFDRCRAAYLPACEESRRLLKIFKEEVDRRGLYLNARNYAPRCVAIEGKTGARRRHVQTYSFSIELATQCLRIAWPFLWRAAGSSSPIGVPVKIRSKS